MSCVPAAHMARMETMRLGIESVDPRELWDRGSITQGKDQCFRLCLNKRNGILSCEWLAKMGAQKGSLMPVDEFLQLGMKHRANWFELEMLQDKDKQWLDQPGIVRRFTRAPVAHYRTVQSLALVAYLRYSNVPMRIPRDRLRLNQAAVQQMPSRDCPPELGRALA